jgi:hypothetical protein
MHSPCVISATVLLVRLQAGLLATSFRYTCLVAGTQLRATLQDIAGDEERYSVCVVNVRHSLLLSQSPR